jgi:RNA polymerase-binding transcription factor DksA
MDEAHARELLFAERDRLDEIRADIDEEGTIRPVDLQDQGEEVDGQHPGDVGTDVFERERDMGQLEDIARELHDIEDALKRLDDGTYGKCEVCGRPIPDERLEAYPTARYDAEHEPRDPPPLEAPR